MSVKQQIENMICPGPSEIYPAPLSSTKKERKENTKNEEKKRSVHHEKYAKTNRKTNTSTTAYALLHKTTNYKRRSAQALS